MSLIQRTRPRLSVVIPHDRKNDDFEQQATFPFTNGGNLSPDLQPATPPTYHPLAGEDKIVHVPKVTQIGKYLLLQQTENVGDIQVFRAFHCDSQQEYVCKVICIEKYRQILSAYWRVGHHEHINQIENIILGQTKAYVFFESHHGDLHSYVRKKKRLRESETVSLFRQIMSAVEHCHEQGLVLRDLKLRKFVFKNKEKTELKLECLEDAFVLDDEDNDCLADKHGCPAYVSPEILNTKHSYSGRAADMWSAGVMLYTMLIGRYPFHDTEPNALFSKIRRGEYRVPESVTPRARCLIRCLLRREPQERLGAGEVLQHPWVRHHSSTGGGGAVNTSGSSSTTSKSGSNNSSSGSSDWDQLVPDVPVKRTNHSADPFFL